MTDARTTVDAYHRAWTGGDVEAALDLLDEDARCTAPGTAAMTKEQWRSYLAGFAPRLTAAPGVARMTDEDRVALWYLPQTATTTTALAAELFTVRDGRITEIRLVFDRLSYGPPA
jgi:ketosteroid isomerase-like protein